MNSDDRIQLLVDEVAQLKEMVCLLVDRVAQPDKLLTIKQAAEELGVSVSHMRTVVKSQKMPVCRPSGKPKGDIRVRRSDLYRARKAKVNRGRKTKEVSI